ncbi:membrane lipoprotein lipid attachment site-containing protein [Alistipes sp. OttesenSCG-928-B03]|nr:membrane lipoprotein lipid attachment site-containing protein [Alistipes sp. OttesenSCG-928-B03]
MKKILIFFFAAAVVAGCEQVSTPGDFYDGLDYITIDSLKTHLGRITQMPPFATDTIRIYPRDGQTVQRIHASLMGFMSETDRNITISQIHTDSRTPAAEPDVHYVPFDAEVFETVYILRGSETLTSLPVYIQPMAVAEKTTVLLEFELSHNTYFNAPGYANPQYTRGKFLITYYPND